MTLIEKLIKAFFSKPTLSFHERMVQAYIKGKKMPLKGHTRIIFTDEATGEERVVADTTNLVTNAVASILSRNYSGLASIASLLPLKSLYSGVLCFQNEITEDADNYNPPDETTNPLVAHAGQTANDTASVLRGNPVISDIVETDTSVKWVWSWDSSHGNGTIRTVCLCPDLLGNMGLKPFDTQYNPLYTFGNDSTTNQSWSEEISKQYPFNIASDGKSATTVWASGTTFKEYTIRHDYSAFGIMRDPRTWQDVSTRTATIRSFDGNKSFIFDDTSYYYVATITGATTVQVDKITKADMTVTTADCTFSGISLNTGNLSGGKNNCMRIFAFDGTYMYLPNANSDGFIKCNLTNNADVTIISGTVTVERGQISSTNDGWQFMSPLVINDNLILGTNYIINGNTVYPIAHCKGIGGAQTYLAYQHWLWVVRQGAACYGNAKQTYGSSSSQWSGQSNIICAMFLSTINVLEEPVTKTNTVAMRIEYTISET